ncbi:hypothetical protein T12_15315 [Trichinella patagoniensis]|uniref:Secreted protein n=1 Tax=Trichinella patagoniensis TaxID=990121 RepID=A0A0V0ZDX8_9BILA|nr:hypothetical protein T12_15315 [Trichinella patagoniensis]
MNKKLGNFHAIVFVLVTVQVVTCKHARTKEPGSNNVNGWLHAVNHRLGCRLVVCFLRLCTLKEPPLRQKFENSRAFRLILTELILRRLLLLFSEVDLQIDEMVIMCNLNCTVKLETSACVGKTKGGSGDFIFEPAQELFNGQM